MKTALCLLENTSLHYLILMDGACKVWLKIANKTQNLGKLGLPFTDFLMVHKYAYCLIITTLSLFVIQLRTVLKDQRLQGFLIKRLERFIVKLIQKLYSI